VPANRRLSLEWAWQAPVPPSQPVWGWLRQGLCTTKGPLHTLVEALHLGPHTKVREGAWVNARPWV